VPTTTCVIHTTTYIMNSAVKRLLVLFFSFAAFTACDDPSDIGLDLQDENLIGTEFVDTLTIKTGTVFQGDSILSFRTGTAIVGQYADPVMGKVRATTFSELMLNGTALNFGENATVDSLVLTLDYGFKYADTLKAMQVNVHRLTSRFDERTSYFTNTPFAYDPTPIGSAQFKPQIYVEETDGTKTKKTRFLRVKLSAELANEFMAQSGQPAFADQASFVNFFKGIALAVPEDENASLVSFTFGSANSNVTLHYSAADGTKRQHSFLLGAANYFSQIIADRTGTAIADLQAKGDFAPAAADGDTYVQAGTQLLTKINIPYLQKFKEEAGALVVNRAELIIPIKASSTTNNRPTPPQLVLYETNSQNQLLRDAAGTLRTVQQDGQDARGTLNPAILGATRKNGKEYYSLNVTSYVQGIMLGNKTHTGLMLGAVVATSQDRGIAIRPELRPYRAIVTNNEANPIRLLIYYSKLQ
jgi:hypothetical protein